MKKQSEHPIPVKIDYTKHLNPEQLRVVMGADAPCLVLAGAGSGKTRELQERTRILSESGKHAFFCRIEDLADEGLQQALPMPDDIEEFQAWIKSGDGSIFFLDSVDEARLRGYRLDRPLRKLVRRSLAKV